MTILEIQRAAGRRGRGGVKLPSVRAAFKEWAVIVDALGRGTQTLILRKGGIHEGRGGFQPEHARFLLFPTRFHQQRDSVVSSAQARFDALAAGFPPADEVRIEFMAEVRSAINVRSLDALLALRGLHVWRDDVLRDRFSWGADDGVHALIVRILHLPVPQLLPMLESYGGCRSWIQLETDLETADAEAVLSDANFEEQRQQIESILRQPGTCAT